MHPKSSDHACLVFIILLRFDLINDQKSSAFSLPEKAKYIRELDLFVKSDSSKLHSLLHLHIGVHTSGYPKTSLNVAGVVGSSFAVSFFLCQISNNQKC